MIFSLNYGTFVPITKFSRVSEWIRTNNDYKYAKTIEVYDFILCVCKR